jgi:hypothetical protein
VIQPDLEKDDVINLTVAMSDDEDHLCLGTGTGSVMPAFLELDGTFEYTSWEELMSPGNAITFRAYKTDLTLRVDFFASPKSGRSAFSAHVGVYKHEDVKPEVDLRGPCTFSWVTLSRALRPELKSRHSGST